jgi:hypothetical protein
MLRSEVDARLAELAGRLEADLRLSQTRDQHVRMSQRLAEVNALRADLSRPDAAEPAA